MQKSDVRDAIVTQLKRELELQARAAHDARDEATSEESKSENKYDTRGQEAAYLAEGQAKYAVEIAESIAHYLALDTTPLPEGAPAVVGSLLTLENNHNQSQLYFLGPRNGGLEVTVEGHSITVVTPTSPLGRQLLGQKKHHQLHLGSRGNPVIFRITALV